MTRKCSRKGQPVRYWDFRSAKIQDAIGPALTTRGIPRLSTVLQVGFPCYYRED
jgi:hypothetical protein